MQPAPHADCSGVLWALQLHSGATRTEGHWAQATPQSQSRAAFQSRVWHGWLRRAWNPKGVYGQQTTAQTGCTGTPRTAGRLTWHSPVPAKRSHLRRHTDCFALQKDLTCEAFVDHSDLLLPTTGCGCRLGFGGHLSEQEHGVKELSGNTGQR